MKKNKEWMNMTLLLCSVFFLSLLTITLSQNKNPKVAGSENGFDQYGYNYTARLFNGTEDGADRKLDGTYWGNPTYANDHLVMKWSKAWDDARFHGAAWGPTAWVDNEYNGKVPGGSGEVWHYKIKWVGACGADGTSLPDGGYCIWGQFEVIFSQGTKANKHFWDAHANPAGYGMQ